MRRSLHLRVFPCRSCGVRRRLDDHLRPLSGQCLRRMWECPVDEPFARCERCAVAIHKYEWTNGVVHYARVTVAFPEPLLRRRIRTRRPSSASPATSRSASSADANQWRDSSRRATPAVKSTTAATAARASTKQHTARTPQEEVHYTVGLIVKLGGGSYRQVFARLHSAMHAKLAEASVDQLCNQGTVALGAGGSRFRQLQR